MFHRLKMMSVFALVAGFVSTAHAGFLVEPYLGYTTGETKQGPAKADFAGAYYGARLGFKHMTGLMGGVDYMTGKLKDEFTPANDITPNQLGVFVGFEFPMLLRVYGVYGLSNKADFKNAAGSTDLEGDSHIKLGVGFTALPLLSINLEYMMTSYDEAGGVKLTNKIEGSSYGLSVSIPLDF